MQTVLPARVVLLEQRIHRLLVLLDHSLRRGLVERRLAAEYVPSLQLRAITCCGDFTTDSVRGVKQNLEFARRHQGLWVLSWVAWDAAGSEDLGSRVCGRKRREVAGA